MGRPRTDPKVRFWAKVDKTDGCWEWTGPKFTEGYGSFWVDYKVISAHRQSYLWEIGSIPEGYDIDHLCRNIACVRPSHLEAVTHAENVRRGMAVADRSKWKPKAKATECPRGHQYTAANTYVDPRGAKRCRECRRTNYQ
jgi:hypothetical protein